MLPAHQFNLPLAHHNYNNTSNTNNFNHDNNNYDDDRARDASDVSLALVSFFFFFSILTFTQCFVTMQLPPHPTTLQWHPGKFFPFFPYFYYPIGFLDSLQNGRNRRRWQTQPQPQPQTHKKIWQWQHLASKWMRWQVPYHHTTTALDDNEWGVVQRAWDDEWEGSRAWDVFWAPVVFLFIYFTNISW